MKSKIILIEGIPGAGKTTLINSLIKNYILANEKVRTLVSLSQSHTYSPVISEENSFYASKNENLNHLDKILQFLKWGISSGSSESLSNFFCLIDTLHITHCFRPGNISWPDIVKYDKTLADVNCKLIFMKALPETILERAILPRSKRENLYLTKYQKRYGNNLNEIHQYYMNEQEKMGVLFENSKLNKIMLYSEQISTNEKAAYDFWLDNGT